MKTKTTTEQTSERELVTTRTINGPARLVFEAWTKPELFQRWWAPKSTGMVIVSCEMDVRVGGGYRLEIRHPSAPAPMPFFGKYLEVTPNARLVWTNDESAGGPITTVTFEEAAGKTRVVLHELFPSKEALAESRGAEGGVPEQFDQLDELLAT
ncbi:SRPBCC family protein [soil metagenome]